MNDLNWILQLGGRFHPLLVHFPIGLLVIALFFEILTLKGKNQGLRPGINLMVYTGTVFAIFSAITGYLLRSHENYSGELIDNHQLLGIATAISAAATSLLLFSIKTKNKNILIYRVALFTTVIFLSVAGHFGAYLTHGENYLSEVLPGKKIKYDQAQSVALLSELNSADSLTELHKDKLNMEVRAIFAHNCYQCHSENKQKGGLILENKEGVFRGGESGVVIVPGSPEESELYRRITLPADDEGVMPKKGKVLKKTEIDIIKLWIKNGAHWSDQLLKVFPEAELALTKPALPLSSNESHPVDKIVDRYFAENNLDWPALIDDRVFVKRVYLDIIGLLPSPEVINDFTKSSDSNKRLALIDTLLGDDHNYTQHWLSFWNDLLRNDYSGPGFITGGRKQITGWLYSALKNNMSYDQMVRELVNPNESSEGFIKGIQWRGVVNASQRTEMQAAQNVGQSLMGVNVKCASCHNSFVSNVTLKEAYGLASIFSDTLLEMNRCDKPLGKKAEASFLYPELGPVEGKNISERLESLSEIMVKPENGRLYRTITNRIWERLMGRGIIEPLDEMDNPPWNAEILDWLAADFQESGSDLKKLIRNIVSSKSYQLPFAEYENKEDLYTDYTFTGPVVRRLSAEQFTDAVSQVIFPVYPAVAYHPVGEKVSAQRVWHEEIKFDRRVLPEPGKRYFRKTFILPEQAIESGKVIISVDHSFVLYLNGAKVSEGEDWRVVDKLEVTDYLVPGENLIAIEGENEGKIANPAGILFSLKVTYPDYEEITIHSDKTWVSVAETPEPGWYNLSFNDEAWEPVHNYGNGNWGKLIDFTFQESEGQFARASLVKQHPFMKALGRPTRENVATTRDQQATLLQALELTNGEFFNGILEKGANSWLKRYPGDAEKIIEDTYLQLLGRSPSSAEMKTIIDILGKDPGPEEIQDFFWSVLILPEFQFIN